MKPILVDSKKKESTLSKLLSSYEKGILEMAERNESDVIQQDQMMKSSFKKALGMSFDMETSDGSKVCVSARDMMAMAAIADAIEKPSMSKYKDACAIMGELKENSSQILVSIVDSEIEALGLKEVK